MTLLRLNRDAVHFNPDDIDSISSLRPNTLEVVMRNGEIFYGYYIKD